MAIYKIELTSVELEKLNQIKRAETRKTAMTVYTKMKKYTNISTGIVFRTMTDILKLINRSLELSKTHLYRIISTLKELALITSKNASYFLTGYMTNEESSIEAVEEQLEEVVQATEVIAEKTIVEAKDYSNHEVVPPVEVVAEAKKMVKTLYHGNSYDCKFITELVVNKLREAKVNRAGMVNYISAVIADKVQIVKAKKANVNREVKVANIIDADLEAKLLGW